MLRILIRMEFMMKKDKNSTDRCRTREIRAQEMKILTGGWSLKFTWTYRGCWAPRSNVCSPHF